MVRLVSETLGEKDKMLIIEEKKSDLSDSLKKYLEVYDVSVFKSPLIPDDISRFKRIFLINPKNVPVQTSKQTSFTLFVLNNKKLASRLVHEIKERKKSNVKVILLSHDNLDPTEIDSLLWFAFSKDTELFLDYEHVLPAPKKTMSEKSTPQTSPPFIKKPSRLFVCVFILLVLFGFIPFLLVSLVVNFSNLNQPNKQVRAFTSYTNNIATTLYTPVRPLYLLFSIALIPDTAIQINNDVSTMSDMNQEISRDVHGLIRIVFKSGHNVNDTKELLLRLQSVQQHAQTLENTTSHLSQSLPAWTISLETAKKKLRNSAQTIAKLEKVLPLIKEIINQNETQEYLVLIADNNNLRAGGGLINFLGNITVHQGSIESMHFFASSDLTASVSAEFAPPEILKQYANQETLRFEDIAYSPDFADVSNQARFFLERQTNLKNVNGVFLITTDGLRDILGTFPQLYLDQANEKITKENISIKLALHKKDSLFINNLFQTMADTIDTSDVSGLISALAKALDEKQIAISFNQSSFQKVFDNLYWSGKTITPQCIIQNESCTNDYFYTVDQNMTENNIDAYIRKKLAYQVHIDHNGLITNNLLITIQNNSPFINTSSGVYHNYFQILLPKNSSIDKITKNGVLVESYDELLSQYKIIGFYLEIPAGSTSNILIAYKNGLSIQPDGTYQLIVQKQIGTADIDFSIRLQFPSDYHVGTQNFIPVVKDREIFYNTSLNTDKLFFIQFKKM